jgi:hypothetical protein
MKKLLTITLLFAIMLISFTSCAIFKKSTTTKNTLTTQNTFTLFVLTTEGTATVNTVTDVWLGVDIPRSTPTTFTFRNNSITSVNASGYMLLAGDENASSTNNNLDGEVITGNLLTWNGTDMTSITHGLFTGCNINAVVEYNYLNKVPMSIVRKSYNGMTNTAGGVAYNIINNPIAVGTVVKGMNNVNIYNNTYYSNQPMYNGTTGTWRGIVDIYTNTDVTPNAPSTGTKIKNNIFYTKNQIYNIYIYDAACLSGFESDYNLFYCEAGTPVFNYLGTQKTFTQWQALGYDIHSIVINPNFNNFTDFVPTVRLNYGTNLGTTWQTGLSTTATWVLNSSPATINQNGTWQVGARVYDVSALPVSTSSVIQFIITKNPNIVISIKGINGIKYYNNIFYSTKVVADNPVGTGIIDVYQIIDTTQTTAGAKIFNNIFYTVNQIPNIRLIDANSLVNFESDYNIFYCEAGTPIFTYLGTQKTFAEWQALGYDTHSIITNPKFK